jgi:hypothetical protein
MNTFKVISSLTITFVVLLGPQPAMADYRPHWREESHSVKKGPSHPAPQRSSERRRSDYRDDGREPSYKHYYKPGHNVKPLPKGYSRVLVNSLEYFFFDGFFYRPHANGYVVVDAPIGAVITQLPRFSQLVYWHKLPYYAIGNTYYRPHHKGYVVVPDPGFGHASRRH